MEAVQEAMEAQAEEVVDRSTIRSCRVLPMAVAIVVSVIVVGVIPTIRARCTPFGGCTPLLRAVGTGAGWLDEADG